MNKQIDMEKEKLNNSGFSLVEVLIAMIILAVVSVPLIRSFTSVAITNSNAKKLMLATDCAENMMEIIEFETVDDLVATYSVNGNNKVEEVDGKYTFTLKEDLPTDLPDGYRVEVTLDPSLFPNNNAINLADVKSMSITNTAVYEMSPLYDTGIYDTFAEWNKTAHEGDSTAYFEVADGTEYFKKNLTRKIEVTINKVETREVDGEQIDIVNVSLDVLYYFKGNALWQNYLPETQKEYKEDTKEIFANGATEIPLEGIYVIYQPRYEAADNGNADEIVIHNPDNVEVDVFVAAQCEEEDKNKERYFRPLDGAKITVEEDVNKNGGDAGITLFTNLSKNTPYDNLPEADGSIPNGELLCRLSYVDVSGKTGTQTGITALTTLDGRNIDGKALVSSNTKTRIYKVYTKVFDNYNNEIVELDGTKLE